MTERGFEKEEATLYLALEQILREMSQSTRPQRKLADELITLLQHHYDVISEERPSGEVTIEVQKTDN